MQTIECKKLRELFTGLLLCNRPISKDAWFRVQPTQVRHLQLAVYRHSLHRHSSRGEYVEARQQLQDAKRNEVHHQDDVDHLFSQFSKERHQGRTGVPVSECSWPSRKALEKRSLCRKGLRLDLGQLLSYQQFVWLAIRRRAELGKDDRIFPCHLSHIFWRQD